MVFLIIVYKVYDQKPLYIDCLLILVKKFNV